MQCLQISVRWWYLPSNNSRIADAQRADATLKCSDKGLEVKLIENTLCVCNDGRLVIPKPLQRCAVLWHHHYLQHPVHTHIEEMINAVMYWKGMRTSIWLITRSCKACQINKRWNVKYGHLPPKSIITNPWEYLCVDLIGPYTLKGRDNSQIDFMDLTMADPTSSCFEIVELSQLNSNIRQIQN